MELTAAIPAAAPAPLRKVVGNVQKTGRTAKKPKPAAYRETIFSKGVGIIAASTRATTMTSSGMIVRHSRSPLEFECRLHSTMPMAPTM
jgi:hypothetical protein